MKYTHWNNFLLSSDDMEKIAISSADLERLVINPAIKNKTLVVGRKSAGMSDLGKTHIKLLKKRLKQLKAQGAHPNEINEFKFAIKSLKNTMNDPSKVIPNRRVQGGIAFRNYSKRDMSDVSFPNSVRTELANVQAHMHEQYPGLSMPHTSKFLKGYKGVAFINKNPAKGMRNMVDTRRILEDKNETRAFKNLVAAHELEELDPVRKSLGGKWSKHKDISDSTHNSMQAIGDIQRVRSMPRNDAPLTQEKFRLMRESEIDEMLEHAPGLAPVLKEHSSLRNLHFDVDVSKTVRNNRMHNKMLEAGLANKSQAYQDYVKRKYFKPTDYDQVYAEHKQLVEPRINRHMKRHIGKTLDNVQAIREREAADAPILQQSMDNLKKYTNKGVGGV
jgi:hypothetical protein